MQNSQLCHSRDSFGRESSFSVFDIVDARQKHSGMTKHFAISWQVRICESKYVNLLIPLVGDRITRDVK